MQTADKDVQVDNCENHHIPYIGIKRLSKWIVNDGNQNSQHWSRRSQVNKGVF